MRLDDLYSLAKSKGLKKVAVVCPYEDDALGALIQATAQGLVAPVAFGDEGRVKSALQALGSEGAGFEFVHCDDDSLAVERAVRAVHDGQCHLLMKGMIKTAKLLSAVLNKEWGLRGKGLLSHMGLIQPRGLDRLLGVTDGGMNTYPDLAAKVKILENAVACFHKLGYDCPKVAALAAVEVVNPDMTATLDAAALVAMNGRGQLPGCLVDGPFALDNAISEESARIKGLQSPVAGKADILLVPAIEAGNMLAKAEVFIAGGDMAGVVLGAAAPIVMTSRFDTVRSKLLSLALGAVLA